MSKELLFVSRDEELAGIQKLIYEFKRDPKVMDWIDDRTLMLMVSPDFSGIVTTILSQALSGDDGEIMYTDVIHVPDPDEDPALFHERLLNDLPNIAKSFEPKPMHKFILVEAGIISGRNYTWVTKLMQEEGYSDFITVALYQNIHSVYKCDFVANYYDAEKQDLCFWWEKPNKAFGDFQ